jgi:solute carrier family 26 protein
MEEGSRCQIKIDRPVYEHDQLRKDFDYDKSRTDKCSTCLNYETNFKKLLLRTIPVVGWLRHYKWKNDIVADIVAGFTVAIMHIPQGMAYGLLGNVPPVVGIYMAFFPVLIYFFLGTSRHNSMAGCCQEIVVPSANRIDRDCRRDFSFQILQPRRDLLY